MSSQRSTGYPLFLWICRAIGLSLGQVIWAQLAVFSCGLVFLSVQVFVATQSIFPAVGIGVLCAINPELNKFAFAILPETVFATLLLFYFGILIRLISTHAPSWLAGLCLVAGLAYAVRPVGAALITATALVAVYVWRAAGRRRTAAYAIALLPLILTVGGETILKLALHGTAHHTLSGLHAFAKAGMVDAQVPDRVPDNAQSRALHDSLEKDLSNVRALIAAAPTSYVARHLTIYYESFVQYRFAMKEREAAAAAMTQRDPLLLVGLQRLRYGLGGYANLTYRHYLSLWNLYDVSYPGHVRIYNAYLADNAPLPLSDAYPEIAIPAKTTGPMGWIVRPAIQIMGLMTAVLAALGLYSLIRPRNIPPLLAIAGFAALMIHGYCMLTALTALGIPRYLLVLWPVIIGALGLAAWHFFLVAVSARYGRG